MLRARLGVAAINRHARAQPDKEERRWKLGYLARHVADKLRWDGATGLRGGVGRRGGSGDGHCEVTGRDEQAC
ncbi:hypothetical protein E2562_035357 [Oryza meyeriana var. granulata]|uniref:Uncharacterized protein n=1 Tax=Oryza meyeriana var. granulata TaxID=110450 RepID=A0A6G1BNS3_9ORYZ|nr:hypothetical protein E2562_035357 [Oryza meyeriana var. granulata]